MYTILDGTRDNILAVRAEGKIDIEEERRLVARAEEILAKHDKLRVLAVLEPGLYPSLHAFVVDVAWIIKHMRSLEKVAIVTDSKVLGWLIEQDARIARHLDIEERHFEHSQMEEAWDWIGS